MSSVEKSKKKRKGKKKKAQETESEVLERVMDSIEMAGASLEFFDEGDSAPVEEETSEVSEEAEVMEASSTEQELEPSEEMQTATEEVEASTEETESLDLEEAENMEMLPTEEKGEFIDDKQALSILESLLFSSERPLGIGTFKQVFKGTNYKTKEIKKALENLQIEYADASRGVSLEEINGGWQLRTKVDNMDFLRKLAKARPFKLSGPALEVLAIVAYKQPIIKSEVDEIRGVESGHLVRALMEKHLVCFQGKSELPGKPMQYGTTRKFLEIFGLRNLRELPSLDEIDQLLPDGIGIEEEDEKLSDITAGLSENYEGNYSEGEEELVKIEDTLQGIDTSSEFFEEEKRRQKEKRDRDRARDIREALDVGEEVDSKDQRWLTRYDEKQAQLAAAAAEASGVTETESSMDAETIDLAGVSEETVIMGEDAETSEALEASSDPIMEETDSLIETPESLTEEFSTIMNEELVSDKVLERDQELESEEEELLNQLSSDDEDS